MAKKMDCRVKPGNDYEGSVPLIAGHRHWQRCDAGLAFRRSENSKKLREDRMAAWRTRLIITAALLAVASPLPMASRAAPSLDFEFFKSRVQPIFLQKRDGHTRCYVCHAESNNAFRLERLAPGASAWSDEQSRKNFEMASILVNPGDPATSRLLQQPLAPEVGGNVFHSGGRQFASKDDPNWKILADWVNGQKL
jgi:hypothetical protein